MLLSQRVMLQLQLQQIRLQKFAMTRSHCPAGEGDQRVEICPLPQEND